MTDQPVTTEHLAELYAAANKANSDLSRAQRAKPRDPDLIERMRQGAGALNSAYDAARRRYKKQQKAASRAELRNTTIRFCLDAQESHT